MQDTAPKIRTVAGAVEVEAAELRVCADSDTCLAVATTIAVGALSTEIEDVAQSAIVAEASVCSPSPSLLPTQAPPPPPARAAAAARHSSIYRHHVGSASVVA